MAKKTTRTPTRARKPKGRASTFEPLVPDSDELIVRMYRQGLGDCFLLALPAGKSRTKYLLIDCGVHKRQTDGPARLAQVLKNLGKATSSHIDVVVATHEHADHLSGFVQKGSPFLTEEVTIGEVWLGWTEKRGDRQADTLRRKRGAAQRVIDKAVEEARARAGRGLDGPGLAKHLVDLTDFEHPADGSVDVADIESRVEALRQKAQLTKAADDFASTDETHGLSVAKKARKTKPSSNELALGLLALKVGDNKTQYCDPGKVRVIDDVSNLRVYVLGPPRSDLLEKEKPTKIRGASEGDPGGEYKEVYLTATGGNRALALNPRFNLNESADELLPEDWRYPFARRYQRRFELRTAPDQPSGNEQTIADEFVWSEEGVAPPKDTRSLINETYLDPQATWRRIDGDWLKAAESLALDLAGDTNNTSVALAFEWGPRGRGRVLLFPADAQVGNWLVARPDLRGTEAESRQPARARPPVQGWSSRQPQRHGPPRPSRCVQRGSFGRAVRAGVDERHHRDDPGGP
jgi:hypothetical protein